LDIGRNTLTGGIGETLSTDKAAPSNADLSRMVKGYHRQISPNPAPIKWFARAVVHHFNGDASASKIKANIIAPSLNW
jgi:hypothetical protein